MGDVFITCTIVLVRVVSTAIIPMLIIMVVVPITLAGMLINRACTRLMSVSLPIISVSRTRIAKPTEAESTPTKNARMRS